VSLLRLPVFATAGRAKDDKEESLSGVLYSNCQIKITIKAELIPQVPEDQQQTVKPPTLPPTPPPQQQVAGQKTGIFWFSFSFRYVILKYHRSHTNHFLLITLPYNKDGH